MCALLPLRHLHNLQCEPLTKYTVFYLSCRVSIPKYVSCFNAMTRRLHEAEHLYFFQDPRNHVSNLPLPLVNDKRLERFDLRQYSIAIHFKHKELGHKFTFLHLPLLY